MTEKQKFPRWVYLRFGKGRMAEIWRECQQKKQNGDVLTVQEKLILAEADRGRF